MGKVIRLKVAQQPVFSDLTDMLNTWWKELEKKPISVKPVRIRHLVETAHAAGWTINECYDALNITWGYTEAAFETALRRNAEESRSRVCNINDVSETQKALALNKKESLSIDENVRRLRELKEKLKSKG